MITSEFYSHSARLAATLYDVGGAVAAAASTVAAARSARLL